ncbi:MAG TPA: hypothetical protein VFI06_07155 [Chitinophagaceae bacterium]|nr:hypothetical protein [Chitinophagaceae bacterium]
MTKSFCTIITADHYPRALALYKSIIQFDPGILLHVLIADNNSLPNDVTPPAGMKIMTVSQLNGYSLTESLYRKYAHIEMDFFRWSLKPVFISYLLENGFEKLLYTDCDMFFFNDYSFLFSDLDTSSVLLTPHWRNSNPLTDRDSFVALFSDGIFTAGFIGANKNGLPAMKWWAEACHFLMDAHPELGINDDQRYLDIFPVYFEGTKIIRHRGCTIGAWHYEECKRELVNGQVLINGEYPVIFIHFEDMLASQILKGHDKLLLPYLNEYKRVFEESGYRLGDFIKSVDTYARPGALKKIKWTLRPRTRIKNFLYKLASRL